jgi:thymidine kinase
MTYKLYFRYGAMNSSKTANLLMVAYNYKQQGKKVLLIKPAIDSRFDSKLIKSRSGIECNADYVLEKNDSTLINIDGFYLEEISAILVDEAQFLTKEQVDSLRELTTYVPVICYGLRTDYKTNLFEGSKRLLEVADTIEEIKTICNFCEKKAIINMKYNGNKIIKDGTDEIELGAEDKYLGVCWNCWFYKTEI